MGSWGSGGRNPLADKEEVDHQAGEVQDQAHKIQVGKDQAQAVQVVQVDLVWVEEDQDPEDQVAPDIQVPEEVVQAQVDIQVAQEDQEVDHHRVEDQVQDLGKVLEIYLAEQVTHWAENEDMLVKYFEKAI